MEEPSVLDYLKAKINPFRAEKIKIPGPPPLVDHALLEEQVHAVETDDGEHLSAFPMIEALPTVKTTAASWPWRTAFALIFALIAQSLLEPPSRQAETAIAFYVLAGVAAIAAFWNGEWVIAEHSPEADGSMRLPKKSNWRFLVLGLSILCLLLGFILFKDNRFNASNIFFWLLALTLGVLCLWLFREKNSETENPSPSGFSISGWAILVIAVLAFTAFFRFTDLRGVPGEPFSDHAEKLLDVGQVLNGEHSVFFPRNTGREAFQMYLTAWVATFFGTGLSFMSLKIGTAICGFLTLPFIYLIGKEVGNRWVGLLAMLMAGVAYWPNVISRIGLRFPIYPLFAAPMLYFLLRGLRTRKLSQFILSGIFLGAGLHGYSPARFLPFVVVIVIGLYLLHQQSKNNRKQAIFGLAVVAFISLIVFLPLLRYWVDNPDSFGYRAFTRLGSTERTIVDPIWLVFFSNLWKAWIMFFWDNGNIWVHSIPGRPALDAVTGGFYFLGTVLVAVRYIRRRHWQDLFLLVSVPLLMMPSILSLAFPDENPSLNRTGAAIIPVFIIAAIALEGFLRTVNNRFESTRLRRWPVYIIGMYLIILISVQNYNLVFAQFKTQFLNGAWNTSQIGEVVHGFAVSIGSYDTAYVIPYPYWVDTRLVGIQAGIPTRDYALPADQITSTVSEPRAKMFIFHTEDRNAMEQLTRIFPEGSMTRYTSGLEGKDFLIYFVPELH